MNRTSHRAIYHQIAPVLIILAAGQAMGQSTPAVALAPAQLQFPTTQVGGLSTPQAVNITNTSGAAISGLGISVSGDFSQKNTCRSTLKAGTGCQVNITFAPSAAGARGGVISVTYSGQSAPTTLAVGGQAFGLVSIAISPVTASVPAGAIRQFHAIGLYSDGSTQDVSLVVAWISSDSTKMSISQSGLASALAPGGAQISAVSGNVTATVNVNVTSATLVSLAVDATHGSMPQGYAQQFNAIGTYSDGTQFVLSNAVSWTSSAAAVAAVNTTGLANTLSPGTTLITATLGSVSASAPLTVSSVTLRSMAISPASISMAKGTILQLQAIGTYSDGSTRTLTTLASWSSSSPSIALVNPIGHINSGPVGAATISVSFGGLTATAPVTVLPSHLKSIVVTPGHPSLPAMITQPFTATGTFSDGSTQDVTLLVHWTSSAPGIATVANGWQSQGTATTIAPGNATITASYLPTVSGQMVLTVNSASLVSIGITPANSSSAAESALQFNANGTFSDNSIHTITPAVTWTAANAANLLISNDAGSQGFGYGLASGQNTITASAGTLSTTTAFSISAPNLISINVNPQSATVVAGSAQQLVALGTFGDGSTQDLTSTANWSSSSAAATVGSSPGTDGLAQGVSAGQATITAVYSGVTGSGQLLVTPAQLVSIALTPANPAIITGASQQFIATGTYTDGSTQDLTMKATWGVNPGIFATIGNAPGSQGLALGTGAGQATVTATSGNVSGSTFLTINPAPAQLTTIAISPSSATVFAGSTQQFTATGTYSDGSTQDLTSAVNWSDSSVSVATISDAAGSQGLAQALSAGSATVSASLASIAGTAQLAVVPLLTSITISPSAASISAGGSQQFTATGIYSDNSTQDLTGTVTWSASPAATATVGNAPGTAGLAQALAAGSATVSASFASVTGAASLTVTPVLVSISVTPANPSLTSGSSQQFAATGNYSDGSTQDLTTQVAWSSNPILIATVSAGGKALGVLPGSTTITASAGSISGSTALTVSLPPVTLVSLAISPLQPTLFTGTTAQFLAQGTYSDGSTQNLTTVVAWFSQNASIATITSSGLATAVSSGTTIIGASLFGINAFNAQLSIVPAGPPPGLAPLCQPAPTGFPPLPGAITLAVPPQSCTVPAYPTPNGAPILVNTAAGLTQALANAQCGQWIQLQAGVIFKGAFVVPALACPASAPVLVENSAIRATVNCTATSGSPCTSATVGQTIPVMPQWTLPPHSLAGSSYVPTVESANSNAPFYISDGAANWYIAGIEFTLAPSATNVYPIVAMGENSPTVSALPQNITFDRLLVHPAPCLNDTMAAECHYAQRGLDLNAVNGALLYSNIWGLVSTGQDTQAVNVNNTTGPGLIIGNYLEATGENLMFNTECTNNSGGTAPNGAPMGSKGFVAGDIGLTTCDPPSDFTVRLNTFMKLPAWLSLPAGCNTALSQCYDIKNHAEVKHGQRILFDSNVFKNTFQAAQNESVTANCFAAGLYVCQDLTYTNNLFQNVVEVAVFSGNGEPTLTPSCGGTGQPPCTALLAGQRVTFENNLAVGVTGGFADFQNCVNCTVAHNTAIGLTSNDNSLTFADQQPVTDPNFTYLNNIIPGEPFNNGGSPGAAVAALPNPTFGGDVFVGGYWSYPNIWGVKYNPAFPAGVTALSSPVTSDTNITTPPTTCQNINSDFQFCLPLAWPLVGMVDWAGANAGTNIAGAALSAASPYRLSGTDGMDIGANVPAILAAFN